MSIGPKIRAKLGPLELPVVRAYRRFWVDLGQLADEIRGDGSPAAILEVGCGDGFLTEELSKRFPQSSITAIDIAPGVGRMYRRDRAHVSFRQATIEQIASMSEAAYDVIVLSDVLHHVPPARRGELLATIRRAIRPGGCVVIKEWERKANLAHGLAWFSDRFISGDRGVEFMTVQQLRALVEDVFGAGSVERETRVRPHRNNVALFVRNVTHR